MYSTIDMTPIEQMDSTVDITSMETLKASQGIKVGQIIISQVYKLNSTLET